MENLITTLALVLMPTLSFALDTSVTYQSGILTLLFVGFCALIIIAQLIPAVLMLLGMTKAVTPIVKEKIKGS